VCRSRTFGSSFTPITVGHLTGHVAPKTPRRESPRDASTEAATAPRTPTALRKGLGGSVRSWSLRRRHTTRTSQMTGTGAAPSVMFDAMGDNLASAVSKTTDWIEERTEDASTVASEVRRQSVKRMSEIRRAPQMLRRMTGHTMSSDSRSFASFGRSWTLGRCQGPDQHCANLVSSSTLSTLEEGDSADSEHRSSSQSGADARSGTGSNLHVGSTSCDSIPESDAEAQAEPSVAASGSASVDPTADNVAGMDHEDAQMIRVVHTRKPRNTSATTSVAGSFDSAISATDRTTRNTSAASSLHDSAQTEGPQNGRTAMRRLSVDFDRGVGRARRSLHQAYGGLRVGANAAAKRLSVGAERVSDGAQRLSVIAYANAQVASREAYKMAVKASKSDTAKDLKHWALLCWYYIDMAADRLALAVSFAVVGLATTLPEYLGLSRMTQDSHYRDGTVIMASTKQGMLAMTLLTLGILLVCIGSAASSCPQVPSLKAYVVFVGCNLVLVVLIPVSMHYLNWRRQREHVRGARRLTLGKRPIENWGESPFSWARRASQMNQLAFFATMLWGAITVFPNWHLNFAHHVSNATDETTDVTDCSGPLLGFGSAATFLVWLFFVPFFLYALRIVFFFRANIAVVRAKLRKRQSLFSVPKARQPDAANTVDLRDKLTEQHELVVITQRSSTERMQNHGRCPQRGSGCTEHAVVVFRVCSAALNGTDTSRQCFAALRPCQRDRHRAASRSKVDRSVAHHPETRARRFRRANCLALAVGTAQAQARREGSRAQAQDCEHCRQPAWLSHGRRRAHVMRWAPLVHRWPPLARGER
jgi:hypothetical protein